jgi:hypothetical protein
VFGRVLRTGLLGKARALLRGLGQKGEHPSRKCIHIWGRGYAKDGSLIWYCPWCGEERPR